MYTSSALRPVFWYWMVAVCCSPGSMLAKAKFRLPEPSTAPPYVVTLIEPIVPVMAPVLVSLKYAPVLCTAVPTRPADTPSVARKAPKRAVLLFIILGDPPEVSVPPWRGVGFAIRSLPVKATNVDRQILASPLARFRALRTLFGNARFRALGEAPQDSGLDISGQARWPFAPLRAECHIYGRVAGRARQSRALRTRGRVGCGRRRPRRRPYWDGPLRRLPGSGGDREVVAHRGRPWCRASRRACGSGPGDRAGAR